MPSRSEKAPVERVRLMMVEDHEALREVLGLYLMMQDDMELCAEVASGEEALAAVEDAAPDVALVDLSLPGIDGFEVIRRLRRELPAVRCLILSGYKEEPLRETAREVGASAYVLKGQPEAVGRSIRRVLQGEPFFVAGLDEPLGPEA